MIYYLFQRNLTALFSLFVCLFFEKSNDKAQYSNGLTLAMARIIRRVKALVEMN